VDSVSDSGCWKKISAGTRLQSSISLKRTKHHRRRKRPLFKFSFGFFLTLHSPLPFLWKMPPLHYEDLFGVSYKVVNLQKGLYNWYLWPHCVKNSQFQNTHRWSACHARLTSRLLRSDTRDTAPHCETTTKLSCYPQISTHTPNRARSPSFPLTKTIFRCLYTRPVEGRRGTSEGLDRARGKTLRLWQRLPGPDLKASSSWSLSLSLFSALIQFRGSSISLLSSFPLFFLLYANFPGKWKSVVKDYFSYGVVYEEYSHVIIHVGLII